MIALILARGGSKGLPKKNIKLLNGKPLIAYTIEAALQSKYITRVIISTDCPEIAEVAVEYGAELPFMRPDSLASDETTSKDVILYTLDRLAQEEKLDTSNFVLLQPTSPLRTSGDIDAAIDMYKNKKADSVISYCQESHPVRWHKYIDAEGRVEALFDDVGTRRQEERVTYFPNGAIYVQNVDYLKTGMGYAFAYIMPRDRSVDIDTQDDFDYCEYLMNKGN